MAALGQGVADPEIVHPAGIVRLHQLDAPVPLPQPQAGDGHLPGQRLLADLRVGVLAQQREGPLQQLQRAPQPVRVCALEAEAEVHQRAFQDQREGVRVLPDGFLRLLQSRRILPAAVSPQPLEHGFRAVVLHLIAQQHIHGYVEELRHLRDQVQVRHGQLRFPLVDRPRGHPEHLGELLLRQPALLPEPPDVFGQVHLHRLTSSAFTADYTGPEQDSQHTVRMDRKRINLPAV